MAQPLIFVLLAVLALAHAQNCSFVSWGHSFDFSALTLPAGNIPYTAVDGEGYSYDFNVCGVVSGTADTSCQRNNGAICQTQNGQQVAIVAKWTPGAATWSAVDAGNPSAGIQVSFANGDACFPTSQPRLGSITFVCGTTPVGKITASNTGCQYSIQVSTLYACMNMTTSCGYETTDLSPLASIGDVTGVSNDGYNYLVRVCGAVQSEAKCLNSGGTVCQYYNGNMVAVIARWVSAQPATWSWIDPANPTKGVNAAFANGDVCYPTPNPRQATIQFTCSNSTVPTYPLAVTENGCNYAVAFPTSYACQHAYTCGYGGRNLWGLYSSVKPYAATSVNYLYYINVCGVVAGSGSYYTQCANANGAVCQYTPNGQFVAVVARWTDATSATWSYINPQDPTQGIAASFQNGDSCFPSMVPRTVAINFVCAGYPAGQISVTESAVNPCAYNVTFPTSYACSSSSSADGVPQELQDALRGLFR